MNNTNDRINFSHPPPCIPVTNIIETANDKDERFVGTRILRAGCNSHGASIGNKKEKKNEQGNRSERIDERVRMRACTRGGSDTGMCACSSCTTRGTIETLVCKILENASRFILQEYSRTGHPRRFLILVTPPPNPPSPKTPESFFRCTRRNLKRTL